MMEATYKKLKENIFIKYPNRVFVETGTYIGDSVQMALDAGFEKIYSIELSKKYYKIAKDRFNYFENVEIIHGDSSEILPILIKNINEPITFWLDAHYSKGDTALGKYCSPLMIELEQIRKTGIKNHTIMIDDIRCWNKQSDTKPVCNCPKYPCNNFYGFYTGDLISMLKEINPHYDLIYEDHDVPNDILVAYLDKVEYEL